MVNKASKLYSNDESIDFDEFVASLKAERKRNELSESQD